MIKVESPLDISPVITVKEIANLENQENTILNQDDIIQQKITSNMPDDFLEINIKELHIDIFPSEKSYHDIEIINKDTKKLTITANLIYSENINVSENFFTLIDTKPIANNPAKI